MRPHTISAGRRRQARRVVAESQAKAMAKAAAMGHEVKPTAGGGQRSRERLATKMRFVQCIFL